MARNEQLIRQHKLLQLLEIARFGRTIEELRDDLVADLGLSTLHTRTVRRDLEALQASGFAIRNETLERGRVYKLADVNLQNIHEIGMSATEMIALSIGRDLLYPLIGTQYWRGIETFWNKVQETVPDGVYDHYQRYRKTLHVFGSPSKSYANHAGKLKTINRAIVEHKVVQIEYESVGKPVRQRLIEPYGLAVYQGSIYVVAVESEPEPGDASTTAQRLRNWKLDRFHSATALDQWFTPDKKVDISQHLGRSIGIFSGENPTLVKIRLAGRAAAWVREDPWHPDQTLEETDDGGTLMTVPASHPREVLPKILSLGADAELIDPPEFRDAVKQAVVAMSQRYEYGS